MPMCASFRSKTFGGSDPSLCASVGLPHFSAAIEPQILKDARAGRALLLFDLCNEGPSFVAELFDCIPAWEYAVRH